MLSAECLNVILKLIYFPLEKKSDLVFLTQRSTSLINHRSFTVVDNEGALTGGRAEIKKTPSRTHTQVCWQFIFGETFLSIITISERRLTICH